MIEAKLSPLSPTSSAFTAGRHDGSRVGTDDDGGVDPGRSNQPSDAGARRKWI